jgi:hypothetical protein
VGHRGHEVGPELFGLQLEGDVTGHDHVARDAFVLIGDRAGGVAKPPLRAILADHWDVSRGRHPLGGHHGRSQESSPEVGSQERLERGTQRFGLGKAGDPLHPWIPQRDPALERNDEDAVGRVADDLLQRRRRGGPGAEVFHLRHSSPLDEPLSPGSPVKESVGS